MNTAKRMEDETGLAAAVNHEVRAVELARAEERIAVNMTRAAEAVIEVARDVNLVQEQQLVDPGRFWAWAREKTGMEKRSLQRWMQAAREIPEGSPLLRLGKTKIGALLSIEPEAREAFADAIDAEHADTRAVQQAVAERNAARRERDEALRQTGALKRKAREAEREAAQASQRMDELQTQLEQARSAADERLRDAGAEMARLRAELQEARAQGAQAAGGMSQEARAKIDALERELDDALTRYDDAQDKIAQLERRKGGQAQDEGLTLDAVRTAIGAFIAAVGGLPQLLEGRGVSQSEAAVLRGQAAMIDEWAQRVLAAVRG